MSASPIARQATNSQSIPTCKKIVLDDSNQLPADYSSTPGGTLYSTTPGGTRIVYERSVLMNLRNSPYSRTPPTNMCDMPAGMLKNGGPLSALSQNKPPSPPNKDVPRIDETPEQFEMDM